MLDCYNNLPVMYKAELSRMELIILEVSPHQYMRFGTSGLGRTKVEAIEILKKRIMDQFQSDMQCIDWQARQFIPRVA